MPHDVDDPKPSEITDNADCSDSDSQLEGTRDIKAGKLKCFALADSNRGLASHLEKVAAVA